MSRLYLIRHGRTEANLQHCYCGSTDLPLSAAGREELKGLHYEVSDVRFLTSGMLRAEQTLAILFGDVPHERRSAFREVDFGIFEMHTYEELKKNPAYLDWITGENMANIPPKGESGNQMLTRVLAALSELTREDTLLVTHGGVIAAIMEHLFPEDRKNRYQWQPAPGHGYLIEGNSYRPIPEEHA